MSDNDFGAFADDELWKIGRLGATDEYTRTLALKSLAFSARQVCGLLERLCEALEGQRIEPLIESATHPLDARRAGLIQEWRKRISDLRLSGMLRTHRLTLKAAAEGKPLRAGTRLLLEQAVDALETRFTTETEVDP